MQGNRNKAIPAIVESVLNGSAYRVTLLPNLENIIIALAGKCRRLKMYALVSSIKKKRRGRGGGQKHHFKRNSFSLSRNPNAIDEKV